MAFYTWIHNVNYVIKRFLSETFFVTYSHELYKKGHRNNAVFFWSLRLYFCALFYFWDEWFRFLLYFVELLFYLCYNKYRKNLCRCFIIGDIIDIMSWDISVRVPGNPCGACRFLSCRSGWYWYCCVQADQPAARCPFQPDKKSGQIDGGDYAETPYIWLHLPLNTILSYLSRYFYDLEVFHFFQ